MAIQLLRKRECQHKGHSTRKPHSGIEKKTSILNPNHNKTLTNKHPQQQTRLAGKTKQTVRPKTSIRIPVPVQLRPIDIVIRMPLIAAVIINPRLITHRLEHLHAHPKLKTNPIHNLDIGQHQHQLFCRY